MDSEHVSGSIRRDAGEVVRSGAGGFAGDISEFAEFHDADAKLPGVSFRGAGASDRAVNRALEAAYL